MCALITDIKTGCIVETRRRRHTSDRASLPLRVIKTVNSENSKQKVNDDGATIGGSGGGGSDIGNVATAGIFGAGPAESDDSHRTAASAFDLHRKGDHRGTSGWQSSQQP